MEVNVNKIDALNQELTIKIAAEDYALQEKKKLSARRRTAEFKGFRKGMVPASLIQRVYGDQCLAEAVNEVVGEQIQKYVDESGARILGEPLASAKQPEVEWKSGNDFTFIFDLGLTPEVELEVEKSDSITKYAISASTAEKKQMVENLRKFYSEKKEEKKEEKSDEEIEKEVDSRLESQLQQESEYRLSKDIRDYFVKKAGVKLPEEFLKRWLLFANEGKVSKEDIDKEFDGFVADFKWQLVRGYLMKKWELKVEQKDIEEAAAAYVTYQYAMYGLGNVPEELIKEAAAGMLKDRKQLENLIEQVEDRKVMSGIRDIVTFKTKKITSEKFRELA